MAKMDGGGEDPPKVVASQYCFLVDGVEIPLEDYVAGLLSGEQGSGEEAAAIKAAIEACIAAGLTPETGAIWLAIKDCIGSKPVVIDEVGEDPDAAAAAAAAGQLPGTLIIHPGDGTAADPDWVWYVNGDGTVTNIESPDCCPDETIELKSETTDLADAQALADVAAATATAGTLIKVTESDECVTIFEVDANGKACLQERPHRHIYARAAKNIKWGIDSLKELGLDAGADLCVSITLECQQDLRISGGYSFRNTTLFDQGEGNGDWNALTEVNTYTQPILDGAQITSGTIVSAMQGLRRGEEEQVPFDFIIPNVPAGTHEICIRPGITKNTLNGATEETGQINQLEFTVGSAHN